MKTIRLNYIAAVLLTIMLVGCSDDFLSVPPKGAFLTGNYYANRDQAYSGLVGVYDAIRKNTGGFENMVTMMNAGSDDNVAGGGSSTDGLQIHRFDNFILNGTNMPGSFWNDHYQGIFRANTLLSKMEGVPMDATEKARFTAEAKALRALYFFNLVRMFGNIPLILEPVTTDGMYNVVQNDPSEVYTLIEQDLLDAIPNLPMPSAILAEEHGRITRGGAKALLGKVYLYDNKKTEAAAQFADINGTTPGQPSSYGYELLDDYADLWDFNNKFNAESIIECTHSNQSKNDWGFWGSGADEGNSLNVMSGIRTYKRLSGTNAPESMPGGWSFSTFTQDFYDFIKNDPRFEATVFDLAAYEESGEVSYTHGDEDLGYYMNKFMPRPEDVSSLGGATDLNYQQDSYIIRLADTYLMEAEALGGTGARAQALLDAVRARVGLTPVPVSLTAIKTERRAELAGEGHRFFDLVRWGDAATVLEDKGFTADKNEIFPIPITELRGTKLVQNPNYD
ncbi:MAG: RagB/SusD family nutrient uptake outer membrane protein [Chryseolinea sp.]